MSKLIVRRRGPWIHVYFVIDGYLRGWGLSGAKMDLDVGTVIFARRADVQRWRSACVYNIERTFGETCDVVDIHGYNPNASKPESSAAHSSSSSSSTMQAAVTLILRACADRWMRLMLLRNDDPSAGWAKGTRARVLPTNAWTGKVQKLKKESAHI